MRFLSWIFLFISINAFSQTGSINTPSDYNNYIIEEQNKLIKMIIDFNISNLYNNNSTEQNSQKQEILNQIQASINKINAVGAYQGDDKLKNEAAEVFKLYQTVFDIEFNEINVLRNQRENSFESMEKYLHGVDLAEQKLKNGSSRFIKAQKEFAQKYKLSIQQSPGNELDEFTTIARYSRTLFLEYFRVASRDNSFLDALNNQETETMETKRKEIITSANIALANLEKIEPYPHDTTYKIKTVQVIQFHKRFAENEYRELINIVNNPNRLQSDINRFNEIVQLINDQAQHQVQNFNQANKEFLRKNISGH
jgi:hypothetical protein